MIIVYPNSFGLPVVELEGNNSELYYRESSLPQNSYEDLNYDIFREIDEEYMKRVAKE